MMRSALLEAAFSAVVLAMTIEFVQQAKEQPPPCYVPVSVREVHDGDTFVGDLLLPFDVTIREKHFRIRDFDAWESTRARRTVSITELELVKGKAAGGCLRSMLSDADGVYVTGEPKIEMSYDRIMVDVWVDEHGPPVKLVNVAEWMRALGHERK